MCAELPPMLIGAITFHEDIQPPYDGLTEAIYSCGSGYTLVGGDEVRICQGVLVDGELVGQWTGSEPTCEGAHDSFDRILYTCSLYIH